MSNRDNCVEELPGAGAESPVADQRDRALSLPWLVLLPILLLALLAVATSVRPAQADDDDARTDVGRTEIDTDHLFSFNAGSDLGEVGERELQLNLGGDFGRGGGRYSAWTSELSFQYVPWRNVMLGASVTGMAHRISDVPGLDDRNSFGIAAISGALGYQLLDREKAGYGLSVFAEPQLSWIDETSGESIRGYGADVTLALDHALVPDRLVGVFNLLYSPEVSRLQNDGSWSREAAAGIGGGLMFRVNEILFVGVEARYLRKYEALDLSTFSGQAFFLGPSLSIALSKESWLTAGWNVQAWGRAAEPDGALDLTSFSHHEVRLAVGIQF